MRPGGGDHAVVVRPVERLAAGSAARYPLPDDEQLLDARVELVRDPEGVVRVPRIGADPGQTDERALILDADLKGWRRRSRSGQRGECCRDDCQRPARAHRATVRAMSSRRPCCQAKIARP